MRVCRGTWLLARARPSTMAVVHHRTNQLISPPSSLIVNSPRLPMFSTYRPPRCSLVGRCTHIHVCIKGVRRKLLVLNLLQLAPIAEKKVY